MEQDLNKNNQNNDNTSNKTEINREKRKFHPKPKRNFENKKFPFNYRYWVPEIEIKNLKSNPDFIRIVSYNILCDSLVPISCEIDESDLINYPYMLWENRKLAILSELNELDGDIICLQEFERDEQFIEELGKKGYDPRTGNHSEGCAIFWNNKKFKIENLYSLEFNMNNTNKNISEIYDRDNICLFAVMSYLAYPEICFIVANTHILYNNNRGDVKLAQVYQILNSLQLLKTHYLEKFDKVNLILCGDFNSVPNSGVYKMVTEGSVNCSKLDRRKISGQSQGHISYINPIRFKPTLLNNVTQKFKEEIYNNSMGYDNEEWFNSLIRVETVLDAENHLVSLKYKENHIFIKQHLHLQPYIQLKSAYSELLKNLIDFLKSSNIQNFSLSNDFKFTHFSQLKELNDLEVYGIKMSQTEIDRTLNFVKNLTLEPPFSFYGKGMMALVDYIFFNGDILPVRTLNIPDVNKIAFDVGYLPTQDFPSDHISLCVDFQILK